MFLGDVKTLIAGKTGVPVCQQLLTGWANEPQSDADTLTKLKIPHESFLFVSSLSSENNGFNLGYVIFTIFFSAL